MHSRDLISDLRMATKESINKQFTFACQGVRIAFQSTKSTRPCVIGSAASTDSNQAMPSKRFVALPRAVLSSREKIGFHGFITKWLCCFAYLVLAHGLAQVPARVKGHKYRKSATANFNTLQIVMIVEWISSIKLTLFLFVGRNVSIGEYWFVAFDELSA